MNSEIKFNLPAAEYRAAPGINISSLKKMSISPAHYFCEIMRKAEDPTEAMITGTITHSAILEDNFDGFHVRPIDLDGRSKAGKEWLAAHADKQCITSQDAAHISGMVLSVREHPLAKLLLREEGQNEASGFCDHPPTGLRLKGRADRLTTDQTGKTVIVDLKTTGYGDAAADKFPKVIAEFSYHQQAAHYLDIFEASYFVFVVVEKLPPYAVACFMIRPEDLELARFQNLRNLKAVAECRKNGSWPAYGNALVELGLPSWARKEME